MDFKLLADLVSFIANVLTAIASGIAIWVFLRKGKEISAAFALLLNWTFQTTLADLRGKLDRLNEYNANEAADHAEIRNIVHEIAGQVRGNGRLRRSAPELALRLETFAARPRLAEPAKRAMVAEVREVLRNIQVNSMETNLGAEHE